MNLPKGAKYALIGTGLVAAGVAVWYSMTSGKSPVPNSWTLVDVVTGEIHDIDKDRLTSVPMANEKGEFTMVRVHKNEAGTYVVSDRDREVVKNLFGSRSDLKVDLGTYQVKQ